MSSVRVLILDSAPARGLAAPLTGILRGFSDPPFAVDDRAFGLTLENNLWNHATRFAADVVILILPPDGCVPLRTLLNRPGENGGHPPLITVVDEDGPQEIANLLQVGVADFLRAPFDAADVIPRILRLAPDRARFVVREEAESGSSLPACRQGLVGRSAGFVSELEKIPVVASCDAGVLIEGETGTGKELFARAIHDAGTRAAQPFVPVNCGAIPVELAESELFGHERGAFTGAYAAHEGLIAQADGGTLFLDEITALPLLTQVKLLRFLQEREYRPLGSRVLRHADVRVITAADTGLDRAVSDGGFRQDLFYRLNIIRITLPPLRERREDIPLLASFFLDRIATRHRRAVKRLTADALEKLVRYDWPGNVRELEHVIERSVVFAPGPVANGGDISLPNGADADGQESFHSAKAKTVARFERSYIEGLLAANAGNISRAARRAGKNRRAFWELMRKHGIDVDRFRLSEAIGA